MRNVVRISCSIFLKPIVWYYMLFDCIIVTRVVWMVVGLIIGARYGLLRLHLCFTMVHGRCLVCIHWDFSCSFLWGFSFHVLLFELTPFWKVPVIAGFVVVQRPTQDPQILCNYRKSYYCHLSKKSSHFRDGGDRPQGNLPLWPQGIKVASLLAKPTTPSRDHLIQGLGQGN